jgi:hypothetical protein
MEDSVVTPSYAIGVYRSVCVLMWRARPSAEAARDAVRFCLDHDRDFTVLFVVVQEGVMPPGEEARDQFSRLAQANRRPVFATVEGTGFLGAAVRAALTGIAFVTRHRALNVFRETDDAAMALPVVLGSGFDVEHFRGALADLRAERGEGR